MAEKKKGKKMTLEPNCNFSTRLYHLMKKQYVKLIVRLVFFLN